MNKKNKTAKKNVKKLTIKTGLKAGALAAASVRGGIAVEGAALCW